MSTGFLRGNRNHSSIYGFVFAAFPHALQIPHNLKATMANGGGGCIYTDLSVEEYHESIPISKSYNVQSGTTNATRTKSRDMLALNSAGVSVGETIDLE